MTTRVHHQHSSGLASIPNKYNWTPDEEPDLEKYIDAEIFREHCAFCRGRRRIHPPQTFGTAGLKVRK
jgi:hypothetical protein